MEQFIDALTPYVATDVPDSVLRILSQTLVHMRLHCIPMNIRTGLDLFKQCPHTKDPLSDLTELILPIEGYTWDPLVALRRLQRVLPHDMIRYVHIAPTLLMCGHHGLYIITNKYYILLLSNHSEPLIYTEHVLDHCHLQRLFPTAMGQMIALKNKHMFSLFGVLSRMSEDRKAKVMAQSQRVITLTSADTSAFALLTMRPAYDG